MKTKSEFLDYETLRYQSMCQNTRNDTLRSVFLSRSLKLNDGRIVGKIKRGDLVKVEFGRFVNCVGENSATHVIIDVFGYISGQFTIEVCDLSTLKHYNIYLYD